MQIVSTKIQSQYSISLHSACNNFHSNLSRAGNAQLFSQISSWFSDDGSESVKTCESAHLSHHRSMYRLLFFEADGEVSACQDVISYTHPRGCPSRGLLTSTNRFLTKHCSPSLTRVINTHPNYNERLFKINQTGALYSNYKHRNCCEGKAKTKQC